MKTPAQMAREILEKVGFAAGSGATGGAVNSMQQQPPQAVAEGLRVGGSNMVASQTVAGQGLPGGLNMGASTTPGQMPGQTTSQRSGAQFG